jgi:hypothetical protein
MLAEQCSKYMWLYTQQTMTLKIHGCDNAQVRDAAAKERPPQPVHTTDPVQPLLQIRAESATVAAIELSISRLYARMTWRLRVADVGPARTVA